jgi:predicted DNA-binding protein (UPF0278 family)
MRINLMINAKESDHVKLIKLINQMLDNLYKGNRIAEEIFWQKHQEVKELSQIILKHEWERVKNDI